MAQARQCPIRPTPPQDSPLRFKAHVIEVDASGARRRGGLGGRGRRGALLHNHHETTVIE